jgi:hypothetical protein
VLLLPAHLNRVSAGQENVLHTRRHVQRHEKVRLRQVDADLHEGLGA